MNKKIKDDILLIFFFFFKQKTAYEMTASDWSSDVCSSDLQLIEQQQLGVVVDQLLQPSHDLFVRSEERRVGKECSLLCRSRWSPDHSQRKTNLKNVKRKMIIELCICHSIN